MTYIAKNLRLPSSEISFKPLQLLSERFTGKDFVSIGTETRLNPSHRRRFMYVTNGLLLLYTAKLDVKTFLFSFSSAISSKCNANPVCCGCKALIRSSRR